MVKAPAVTTLGAAAAQTSATQSSPLRSRSWILVLGLVGLIASGAAAAAVLTSGASDGDETAHTTIPARPPPDGRTVASDAAAALRPRTVPIEIVSTPGGAEVFDSDGHMVGRTPYRDDHPVAEAEKVRFLISKDGYYDSEVEFWSDRGGSQTVDLRKWRSKKKPPRQPDDKNDKGDRGGNNDLGNDYDHR